MDNTESTQLVLDIIEKVRSNDSQPFKFILSWQEFSYYRKLAVSTQLIAKTMQDSANRLFKEYCKDVIAGISDFNKLLAYIQLLDIKAFYERDLKTLQQMLDEYSEYLEKGNFWYSFLGGRREL
jgi:hypothetical protein